MTKKDKGEASRAASSLFTGLILSIPTLVIVLNHWNKTYSWIVMFNIWIYAELIFRIKMYRGESK